MTGESTPLAVLVQGEPPADPAAVVKPVDAGAFKPSGLTPSNTDDTGDETEVSGADDDTGIATLLQIYEAEEDLVNVNFEVQLSSSDESGEKKDDGQGGEDLEEESKEAENKEAENKEAEIKENEASEEAKDTEEANKENEEVKVENEAEENKTEEKIEENEAKEPTKDVVDPLKPPLSPSAGSRSRSFSLGQTRSLTTALRSKQENRKKKKAGAASKGKPPRPPQKKASDMSPTSGKSEDATQKMSNAGRGKETDNDSFWDDASRSSKNSKVLLEDGEMAPPMIKSLGKSIKNMRTRSIQHKFGYAIDDEGEFSSRKKKAQVCPPFMCLNFGTASTSRGPLVKLPGVVLGRIFGSYLSQSIASGGCTCCKRPQFRII